MKRTWTIIAVSDVPSDFTWYQSLFGQPETQPAHARLWSKTGFGWNCLALPPPVGRARASVVDEPGPGDAWQRAALVLPRRRFRCVAEKSTRPRRPTRRGAGARTRILEQSDSTLRDPDGYYVTMSALSSLERRNPLGRRPNKRLQPAKARGRIRKSRETSALSRLKRCSLGG